MVDDLYVISTFSKLSQFDMSNITINEFNKNIRGKTMTALITGTSYFDDLHQSAENNAKLIYIIGGVALGAMSVALTAFVWAELISNRSLGVEALFLLQVSGDICRDQCKATAEFVNTSTVSSESDAK